MKLDKLDEVSKVAAVKASSSLSKLIHHPVGVDIRPVKLLSHEEEPLFTNEDNMVVGIHVPLSGDLKGAAIMFFSTSAALKLCDYLMKRKEGETRNFTEMEISVLTEVANIVIGNFMGPFAYPLKLDSVLHHVPEFRYDNYNSLMINIISDMNLKISDKLLLEIVIGLENLKVKTFLVILFSMEEMQNVLEEK